MLTSRFFGSQQRRRPSCGSGGRTGKVLRPCRGVTIGNRSGTSADACVENGSWRVLTSGSDRC
jgi:hypothetical protein